MNIQKELRELKSILEITIDVLRAEEDQADTYFAGVRVLLMKLLQQLEDILVKVGNYDRTSA